MYAPPFSYPSSTPTVPLPIPGAPPIVPRPVASPNVASPTVIIPLPVVSPNVASPTVIIPRPMASPNIILPTTIPRPVASPNIILPTTIPRPMASPNIILPTATIPRPVTSPNIILPTATIPRPVTSPNIILPTAAVVSPNVASPTAAVPHPAAPPIQFTKEMISEDTIFDLANKLDQSNFSNLLEFLSDYYYNDESLVDDKVFDQLQDIYEAKYEPYTIVAAEPRGEKVKLPYYMGSLRKLKKESELQRWFENYPGPYLIEDKIDGLTLLIVSRFDGIKRTTTIYTHGKAGYGKDVTHLLDYIRIPSWLRSNQSLHPLDRDIAVRGEIVMNRADFERVGAGFKNARNLVGGIVNSKQSFNPELARELSYYAYRIMNNNESPEQQILYLQSLGFDVPSPVQAPTISMEILQNYYELRNKESPYIIDGLVLYQNRAELYPEGEAPRHVVAFKPETETAITTVIGVEWSAQKQRELQPRVFYDPIFLSGAELRWATGYNARFIVSNNIGPGAKILVTRSGGTIPKILSVVFPAPGGPAWPDPNKYGLYDWDNNQVELVAREINDETVANVFNHFITTLDIKNFGPARTKLLVQHGIKDLTGLLTIRPEQLNAIPGIGPTISSQFYADLHAKISNVSGPDIMAASNFFPGIGVRRFEAIFSTYPNFLELARTVPDQLTGYIQNIKGFNKLAENIVENMPKFLNWLDNHPLIRIQQPGTTPAPVAMPTVGLTLTMNPVQLQTAVKPTLTGMSIVFSGFRSKPMEEQVKIRGGKVSTSVSGNTRLVVAADPSNKTGKLLDAEKRGIPVIGREEFSQMYLS